MGKESSFNNCNLALTNLEKLGDIKQGRR